MIGTLALLAVCHAGVTAEMVVFGTVNVGWGG